MPLRRQDLFGFTPGGPVLEAEEAYGDDWDPRRGGRVLDAEEEYSFTLNGDEDDEFGSDISDVQMFSDAYGEEDETDAQLDNILQQMDSEDFGADPMSIPPELESAVDQLDDLVVAGAQDAVVPRPEDVISAFNVPMRMMKKAGSKFSSFFTPGDFKEIAHAIIADPAFCQWNDLSDGQRTAIVHNAIYYCMFPGVEMGSDDALSPAWEQLTSADVAGLASTLFETFVTATTEDMPKAFYAGLAEIPVLGSAMQAIGWDPESDDQSLNAQAAALWFFGKMGFDIDASIANQITQNGQDIVAACRAAQSSPTIVAIESETLVEDIVPAPTQEMSESGYRGPAPEQILAFGYGVSILGALTGVFR